MTVRVFEVGGSIRDRLLEKENKDRDFAVEATGGWDEMSAFVHANAEKVFLVKPEFVTIRALVSPSKIFGTTNQTKPEAMDFVLCRIDGVHSDGRRPDTVTPGTILDDLARRDFTVNAMARDMQTGEMLDPHGGKQDLEARVLRCVGKAEDRFQEDALRILRAIRFWITKGLAPDAQIQRVLGMAGNLQLDLSTRWPDHLRNISVDRVRDELMKCLKQDTLMTLHVLSRINPAFQHVIFREMGIWLEPTTKQ